MLSRGFTFTFISAVATGWTVRGLNPGGGRDFLHPSRPDQASYTLGTGSFPGEKRPGRGVDHPPTSVAEVKERVDLYLTPPLVLRDLF